MKRIKQKNKTEHLGQITRKDKGWVLEVKVEASTLQVSVVASQGHCEKWVAEHRRAALLGRAAITAVTLKGVLCCVLTVPWFFNIKYFHPHFTDEEKQ